MLPHSRGIASPPPAARNDRGYLPLRGSGATQRGWVAPDRSNLPLQRNKCLSGLFLLSVACSSLAAARPEAVSCGAYVRYTNAAIPVISRPTTNVLISLVPS